MVRVLSDSGGVDRLFSENPNITLQGLYDEPTKQLYFICRRKHNQNTASSTQSPRSDTCIRELIQDAIDEVRKSGNPKFEINIF